MSDQSEDNPNEIDPITKVKLQECFNEFKDGQDLCQVSDLPSMISYLNFPLPGNFIKKTFVQFSLHKGQKFDFDKFCEFLQPQNRDNPEWKRLHDSFEVFDNLGTGKISVSTLSEILSELGSPFTKDEIEHMGTISKPDENDLIDINMITDLLVDDMFDSYEEEEEEEEELFENDKKSTDKENSYKSESHYESQHESEPQNQFQPDPEPQDESQPEPEHVNVIVQDDYSDQRQFQSSDQHQNEEGYYQNEENYQEEENYYQEEENYYQEGGNEEEEVQNYSN